MTSEPAVEGTPPDHLGVLKYWIDRCNQLENENEELRYKLSAFGIYVKPRTPR